MERGLSTTAKKNVKGRLKSKYPKERVEFFEFKPNKYDVIFKIEHYYKQGEKNLFEYDFSVYLNLPETHINDVAYGLKPSSVNIRKE